MAYNLKGISKEELHFHREEIKSIVMKGDAGMLDE